MNEDRQNHVFSIIRNSLNTTVFGEFLGDSGRAAVAGAIAEGIEAALAWQPTPKPTLRYNMIECRHSWEEFITGPSVTTRVICVRHGVRADSGPHPVSTSPRSRQREEALSRLDEAHGKL